MTFNKSFVVTLAILMLSASLVAQTQGANSVRRCSLATLKGTYGVLEEGTIVQQIPGFLPPPVPIAIAATAFFDGAGKLSGTATASVGGFINTGPFAGTYTVNPDCTYSDEFTDSLGFTNHHAGAIIGDGMFREIQYIYTDAGTVAFGTAKKTPPGGCSLETLKGKYEKLGHSTVVAAPPGFPPTPFPTAEFVIVTYDGAGNAAGTFTINFDGMVFSGTGTSTYTVNRDCSYSEETTLVDGSVLHATGTVTGEGIHQEVRFIATDSGQVSSGTMKKM
jgi:hypothetical protein